MGIELVTIGKIKNPHLDALAEEYAERIRRFVPFRIAQLKDSRGRDEEREAARIMDEEGERILRSVRKDAWMVLLDRQGRELDSHGFARLLDRCLGRSSGGVSFVVGGFLGIADPVRKRADETISLSTLTFPHEIAQVVLLEQLFRAFTILRNIAYHK